MFPSPVDRLEPSTVDTEFEQVLVPVGADDERQRLLEIGARGGGLARIEDRRRQHGGDDRRFAIFGKFPVLQARLPHDELTHDKNMVFAQSLGQFFQLRLERLGRRRFVGVGGQSEGRAAFVGSVVCHGRSPICSVIAFVSPIYDRLGRIFPPNGRDLVAAKAGMREKAEVPFQSEGPMAAPHLTKSRYIAGLQCLRRLWLLVNEPPPFEAPEPGSPLDVGQQIGVKAHLLFPGGALIDEEPWAHAAAVARTSALMADGGAPAIFEAAFEHDAVRVRVDVLERLPDGTWGMREVKSSTGPKDHYFDDIALQVHVLRGAGVPVSSIELIHVNNAHVRGRDGVEWAAFFARRDVRDEVEARLAEVPSRLPAMRECLAEEEAPFVEPGRQCGSPYGCEYWDHCTADKPSDWIVRLPRLSEASAAQLKTRGIEAVSAIPADFPLTGKQAVMREAIVSGRPFVAEDLPRLLAPFGPPACYLDFEAMAPPIPLYEGTQPYQTLPFQWSLHHIDRAGGLDHHEFLADGSGDPRRQFAETLIEALAQSDSPIIVYSAYEQARLRELAEVFPDLRSPLEAVIARLADLLPVVRRAVYFPAFDFSYSIKTVGPALCPDFGYDDLEGVADGLAAAGAFLQIASGALAGLDEMARLRNQLLAYCERDTLAMVKAHEALRALAAGAASHPKGPGVSAL